MEFASSFGWPGFVLAVLALVLGFFLVDTVLDFFGTRLGDVLRRNPGPAPRETSPVWGGVYLVLLVWVITSSLTNFGWIHLLFSPVMAVDLVVVGRLLAPHFGRGNPPVLRGILVASTAVLYPLITDGGDVGGTFVLFHGIGSDTASPGLMEALGLAFDLTLVAHGVAIVASLGMVIRERSKPRGA